MKDLEKICLGCMREKPSAGGACPYCGFEAGKYEQNSRWLPLQYILNGKYMLGKVLGEGGFGITYIGWDLNLEVHVAIKEYFPIGLATRETGEKSHYSLSALMGEKQDNYKNGLKKFMEEAQSLSRFYRLDGIVAVKDLFFENETAYMVMEYLDGVTLKDYLKGRGGQLGAEEALKIMEPVLRSLAEVHKAGIIHRDISTDNIMITKSGETKLIDFGSARMWDAGGNRTFTIVLKHGYAPPEQYQTKGKQGAWTDIYAASATLYRMITGQLPPNSMDRLSGDTLQTFAQLGCKVPDYVEHAVVKKGLALQIGQRYASVEDFYADLYPSKKEEEKTQRYIKLAIAAGAAVSVLFLLWAGAGMLSKNEKPAEQTLTAKVETEEAEHQTETVIETETAAAAETEAESASETELRTEKQSETESGIAETEMETAAAETEPQTEKMTETESAAATETETASETVAEKICAVDEMHFPDEIFRTYVQKNFDTDQDGFLTQAELDAAESIDLAEKGVRSLKGVELFSKLKTLYCEDNELTELDVSRNTALTELYCGKNQLRKLDVSQNTELIKLNCWNNELIGLDVSRNTALENFGCDYNQLTELNVSQNTELEYFSCWMNQLTELDVSQNKKLKTFDCHDNQIDKLDVSQNPELIMLICSENPLSELDVSKNEKLEILWCTDTRIRELDVSRNPKLTDLKTDLKETESETESETETGEEGTCAADETNFPDEKFRSYVQEKLDTDKDGRLTLEELDAVEEIDVSNLNIKSLKGIELFARLKNLSCSFNRLAELDVSRNTALESLSCGLNDIAELDVSKNTSLKILRCYGNELQSLDLSKNTALAELSCYENDIQKLDLSNNGALETLSCFENELRALDVSKNAELKTLWCERNKLEELDISQNLKLTSLKTDLDDSQIIKAASTAAEGSTESESEMESGSGEKITYAVDETNFPDEIFRAYVQSEFDEDKDGILTQIEASRVRQIDVSKMGIKSLKGVELFPELRRLLCPTNQLTELDVSQNTELKKLNCSTNQLGTLDVSKNTALTELDFSQNPLSSIDVSKNLLLEKLYGRQNNLSELDVSRNTELMVLWCTYSSVSGLDVSQNTKLKELNCTGNQLVSLDVSHNAKLERLWCSQNQLSALDVSGNPKLTDLQTDLEEAQIIRPGEQQAAETEQLRYTLSSLNIRAFPDTETGEIIGQLHAGDPVMVTGMTKGKINGAEADWYQILLAEGSGYISASESYTTDNPDEAPAGNEYIEAANPDNCMICLSNRPLTSKNSGTEAAVYKNVYTFCNLFNPNGNMNLESVSISISKDGKAVTSAEGEFTDGYCSVGFIVPEAGTYVLDIVTKAADGSIETGWNTFEALER